MSRNALGLASILLCAVLAGSSTLEAAPFTNGNLVIYRIGDGVTSLVNTGNPVFLDEYTPGGALVQSIALPATVSGANKQLIASGTATSEGLLARSADFRYLVLTGYARNLGGTGSLSGTTAAAVPRTVGRVDSSGAIDTSTALTDFADANNPRGATSVDGSSVWVAGGAGGLRFAALGSTTSTQLSTIVTNLRQPEIYNGQLYVSTNSGSALRVGTVGTGVPSTAGQTITNLPGFPTGGSPYTFVLLDLSAGVSGLDTLYVADDGAGITKYSLVGGSWVSNGTVGLAADTYRGLAVSVNGSTVTLYSTRKGGGGAAGGGELVSVADGSGYNGAFSGTPTLLATAAANTAFRGLALAPEPPPATAAQNVAVYRIGDGTGSLVNTGNVVFVDEIRPDGAVVRSIPLPTTVAGAQKQLIASGTATSEGLMTRSDDGRFLLLTGYARNLGGSGSIAGTTAASVNRTVGRVDASGVVDTSTALTDFADGNNPRGATSSNGTTLWVAGGAGGLRSATLGATTSTQLSTTVTNLRQPSIFSGQLYVSTNSGSAVRIGTVGTGLPTTAGQTITNLPGFPTTTSPYSFFLADLDATVPGVDTLFVADDTIGITKYSLVSGSWVSNGTVGAAADAYRGLAAQLTGTTVTLYSTRKGGGGATGGGELVTLTDSSGYNGAFSGSPVLIATAANNTAYRGVTLVPTCASAELAVTRTAPATGIVGTPFDYVLTVSNQGAAPASGVTLQFTLPSGVTFGGATTVSGFSPAVAGGVVTWSGGSIPAGKSIQLVVHVTPTASGPVTSSAASVVVDPANTIPECDETANTALTSVTTTVTGVANTPPTIQASPTTTVYLSLPATGPGFVSGVISDPTDPAAVFGIDFTVGDAETAAASLTVTAVSGNPAVVSNANLTLSGSGATRNLKILPTGVGYADVTVTVSDGLSQTSYVVKYAASAASHQPATTRFLTGASNASTALAVDANYMLVGDDENQALRLYRRDQSGLPVASFDYTASLGLTDISGGVPREVDIEASTRIGNRLFWLGSMSNNSDGNSRPNRNRLYATDLTGSGATATLSYVGRYDGLKADLLNWDSNNLHGLGANHYGFVASAAVGVLPESAAGDGFNVEALSMSPDGTAAYVGFRAPIVPPGSRTRALIVPVTNFASLVTANPAAGPATFGSPIELDLGGRGLRSLECNANYCLILAGPPGDATGAAPNDFRVYTWSGSPADPPSLRTTDLTALQSDGSFEGIVELPSPLTDASPIQLVVDNGDSIYYNDGVIAKDLASFNWAKSRSEIVTAPASADLSVTNVDSPDPVTSGTNLTYTITAANAGPSSAASVSLVDTLPAGTTFVSLSSPGGWSCTTPAVGAGGTVSCSISSLPVGSAAFTLVVQVGSAVASGTVLSDTATVSSATTDPNPGNESATATTTVAAAAGLSLALVGSPDPVDAGSHLTYTLTATNSGPSVAASSTVTDTLPSGTTFVSLAAPAGWSCTQPAPGGTGAISCAGDFAPGPAVFTLVVQVASSLAPNATISDSAQLTSQTGAPAAQQVTTASAVTKVLAPASVTVTKTVSGQFSSGGTVSYVVILSNAGPADQADNPGPELTDVLPSQLTLISATASSGMATATLASNTVTWNGVVPAGGSVTITIQAKVQANLPNGTVIANQAAAAFDADGNGSNEASALSDEPAAPGAADPTTFQVAAQSIAEVPTLGGFGLAILALLLMMGGVTLMRRARS